MNDKTKEKIKKKSTKLQRIHHDDTAMCTRCEKNTTMTFWFGDDEKDARQTLAEKDSDGFCGKCIAELISTEGTYYILEQNNVRTTEEKRWMIERVIPGYGGDTGTEKVEHIKAKNQKEALEKFAKEIDTESKMTNICKTDAQPVGGYFRALREEYPQQAIQWDNEEKEAILVEDR